MSYATTAANSNKPSRASQRMPRYRQTERGSPMRGHDVRGLTASELERARRELAASLALARPDSPIRAPILAQIGAIDTEMIARTAQAYPAPGPARRPRTGRMQPRRCRPHPEEPEVHHS